MLYLMNLLPTVLIILSFTLFEPAKGSEGQRDSPQWAQSAIWYQIFVERFRNGDESNDPTPESMKGSYPHVIPEGWEITPWYQDWYEKDPWAEPLKDDFHKLVAARRYGGDLKGVIDKLDYLQDLGVNALYFNPLNDAPSLHKYDARCYRHIDPHFGPDPEGDKLLIQSENPLDPITWKWASADKLFLTLIKEVHDRDMKLIVDYSWNHTGITFWAWEDLVQKQNKSKFKNWYEISSFDDPETPENEFKYHGWLGVKTLPELRKINVKNKRDGYPFEGNLDPEVKSHVFNVTKRWMDPNGDGDPGDGVDGFRLDVAHHVPMGFWREYRTFTRSINKDVFLLGEAWWTKWPDQLMDPRPFLKGDVFDSVMHYQWYKPTRKLFAGAEGGYSPSQYVKKIKAIYKGYPQAVSSSLMNLMASHDSPRFSTSFINYQNKYKFNMGARGNKNITLTPPDEKTLRKMRMALMHQFTFTSAPHIWNGDELGMWGADDPDCRKPIIWGDVPHLPQRYNPDGSQSIPIKVSPNWELFSYYKALIKLRKSYPELVNGNLKFFPANDEDNLLAYSRSYNKFKSCIYFNFSKNKKAIRIPQSITETVVVSLESITGCATIDFESNGRIQLILNPESSAVLSINTKPRQP